MKSQTPQSVHEIYYGSDGVATRRLMKQLEQLGDLGRIGAQLFRAQKASSRAKDYHGGIRHKSGGRTSYRELAYEKKDEALAKLCDVLVANNAGGLSWGWKSDPAQAHAKWLLYVDLPNGQCSFHVPERHAGPDYHGHWDGEHGSETRIIKFCDAVLHGELSTKLDGVPDFLL